MPDSVGQVTASTAAPPSARDDVRVLVGQVTVIVICAGVHISLIKFRWDLESLGGNRQGGE